MNISTLCQKDIMEYTVDRKILIMMILTWISSHQSVAADYQVSLAAGAISRSTVTPFIIPNFEKIYSAGALFQSNDVFRAQRRLNESFTKPWVYDSQIESTVPFIGLNIDVLVSPRIGVGLRAKMPTGPMNSFIQTSDSVIIEGVGRYNLYYSSIFAGISNQHHKAEHAYFQNSNTSFYTPGMIVGASLQLSDNGQLEIQGGYYKSKHTNEHKSPRELLQPLLEELTSLDMSISYTYRLDLSSNGFFQ